MHQFLQQMLFHRVLEAEYCLLLSGLDPMLLHDSNGGLIYYSKESTKVIYEGHLQLGRLDPVLLHELDDRCGPRVGAVDLGAHLQRVLVRLNERDFFILRLIRCLLHVLGNFVLGGSERRIWSCSAYSCAWGGRVIFYSGHFVLGSF